MTIIRVNRGETAELRLKGRLDYNASFDAGKIFDDTAERFQNVILDLKELDLISSAGLRLMKMLHMKMAKKNGDLVVKNAPKPVMEVFEMTGFVSMFRFE